MAFQLDTDIRFLKGVGERRGILYHKLGIYTIEDLLRHYPRRYIDLSHIYDIKEAPVGTVCTIRARVDFKGGEQRIRKGLSLFKVQASDETGGITLTFFNAKYTVEALKVGSEYLFHGRIGGSFLHKEISVPSVYPLDSTQFSPVYPLTAGLTTKMISANVRQALSLAGSLPEPLPLAVLKACKLPEYDFSVRNIHFPQSEEAAAAARRRLIFEELFFLSLALGSVRGRKEAVNVTPMQPLSMVPFYSSLPFEPTNAQRNAIDDTIKDMCSGKPMNRLIQGDVGSGKTLVAAAAAYFMIKNGGQASMMAPTEILAAQHYNTMQKLLAPLGVRVGLLTGSMTPAAKRNFKKQLLAGEVDLCIGTHALLTGDVEFKNLRLVITDEQHRFGVNQRTALAQKGQNCHVLVMSATPIPRTLALIIYGDLDLSVIDELPPGRQPIATYLIGSSKRARAMNFIKKHLDQGLQAYIVCPLVEQGETDLGLKPAADYAEHLANTDFKGYNIGLLHGKMRPAEKERVMAEFKAGQIQLLVSTTVVEVGVDVPNAVIMLVEDADHFGLSQLHQLRGRVGRGSIPSHCILISDSQNPETTARLKALCDTTDGFKIAEYDLKLRGPGDFFGSRQHGLPEMKIADLASDMDVLQAAQKAATQLLEQNPHLDGTDMELTRKMVAKLLNAVGERPN